MTPHSPAEPPRKRARLDLNASFVDGKDIAKRLSNRNHDTLVQNLTSLRNGFTIHHEETSISPEDQRLVLANSWLEDAPGARALFEIWDETKQTSITCLIISVLSGLLTLLSSQYTFHALGQPIVRTLLEPQYTQRLNTYLNGGHSESILVTLKLFNALSSFAGGREKKAVLESFAWESKSLPKLLNMRRKGKDAEGRDGLVRPDIRTLYILFILSFVDPSASSSIKSMFLEQHRSIFQAIFKGLIQDSYSVVRKVVETCWSGIFSDAKVKRTLKVTLFNEITLSHFLKLYDRSTSEGSEPDQIPADLVHHFMLAICSRPGVGVCFKDRGWYPRETEEEDPEDREGKIGNQRGSRIYNKILLNVLKVLKVNEDPRQQELGLKILGVCPELVAVYWPAAALTLEPRLTSKWIANIAFFGSVISLSVPVSSFQLPNSTLYHPSPPPLNSVIENILPSVGIKAHLSKGLQSPSALVQHCAALALVKCLRKYDEVVTTFRKVEEALQENEEDGQWARRRKEVEREVRRRVPDFQVVVAFSQQKAHGDAAQKASAPPDPAKVALIAESAQRLLWLYHRCLPSLVGEARFDVGRLLQHFMPASVEGQDSSTSDDTGLCTLQQLHILRLLNETDQFSWTNKLDSSHSYLYALLKTYVKSDVAPVHRMIESLLRNILSQSIMFQDNPDEFYLWLASLPTTRRKSGTEAPDGASLTDEGESVIVFLDDCVQRCMKVPYKYLEEMDQLLATSSNEASGHSQVISLLMATVLEQLAAKMDAGLLSASDILAIATFIRRLCFNVATTLEDSELLLPVAQRVDAVLAVDRLDGNYPVMVKAVRREASILLTSLRRLKGNISIDTHQLVDSDPAVREFLEQVETLPIPSLETSRQGTAYELVDWLRVLEEPVLPGDATMLILGLKRLYPAALRDLCQFFHPHQGVLWNESSLQPWVPDVISEFTFEWALVHFADRQIVGSEVKTVLIDAVRPDTLLSFKRAMCPLLQRVRSAVSNGSVTRACLDIAVQVVAKARQLCSRDDFLAFKRYAFQLSDTFRMLCQTSSLTPEAHNSLSQLLDMLMNPSDAVDSELAADMAEYWYHELHGSSSPDQAAFASPWIPYMRSGSLLVLLDDAGIMNETVLSSAQSSFLLKVLAVLGSRLSSSDVALSLRERLPHILSLRYSGTSSPALDGVISAVTEASLPLGHSGWMSAFGHDQFQDWTFSPAMTDARFCHRMDKLAETISIVPFLGQSAWSHQEGPAMQNLLYQSTASRVEFTAVISERLSEEAFSLEDLSLLYAFQDSMSCHGEHLPEADDSSWSTTLRKLLHHARADKPTVVHGRIVFNLLHTLPQHRSALLEVLRKDVASLPDESIPDYLLIFGTAFTADLSPEVVELVIDQAMRWAVEFVSSDEKCSDRIDAVFRRLSMLMRDASHIRPHLADPLITAAIKHRLSSPNILSFLHDIVAKVNFKPVAVNRYLQSILQHPDFFRLCSLMSESEQLSRREAIINLVAALFHLHPANTCQPSHVEPLARVYHGSLSLPDQRLFGIFRLFEETRQMSLGSLLSRWCSARDTVSMNGLAAISNLDANRVFRTCLTFPVRRDVNVRGYVNLHAGAELYDPLYITLLFSQVLLDTLPNGALAWVQLFRTNVVSLIIRGLSSSDAMLRRISLGQIVALYKCLQSADLQEKPHVVYLLNLIRGVKLVCADGEVVRLPSYTTLILAHALRAVFYPSNFIYPHTARFLLQRPTLDVSDVPMLYGMLYSSSDEWKKERLWIVKFLADGLHNSQDWRVFRRRHTWDLLASLFQSSNKDRALRNSILEVLANATCIPEAATTLVTKSAILPWISMQISQDTREEEAVAFVKILENIVCRADHSKTELSTKGAWRSALCRCLSSILDQTTFSANVLVFFVPAIVRVSLSLVGVIVAGLPSLLDKTFKWLLHFEANIQSEINQSWKYPVSAQPVPSPPHRSQTLHAVPERDPVLVWGQSVESLWRVSMTLDEKSCSWDGLTSRLLIWRALVGPEVSPVGEWARRQAVSNMGS
ncbi:hypothetical protein NEOLEDRAFT_1140540 [Neolentinus lepideus HHB14362 ss-1]|uniref:Nucleolar pre-ribosomal-associated protein 1 C-terminal domain-containing protein n=1 Tax=Neolentinus lepideus HHB14362 ss-1 TaxID=1314782 RepID=A0A165P5W5_9AGAM|nr:hypothetical protein NEOLEDRAFT_1140540 [Neolentinus lepideus HHB14362 ss-1]